jgi:predicted ATPase/DNA-binding winged helix-turn-helix (wHTH) protein
MKSKSGETQHDQQSLSTDTSCSGGPVNVTFGPFSFKNRGETLYRGDVFVHLGSRARHILTLLTARAGQMVSKSELIAEVWPDTTVAENNLTVHIAALRRALGDGQDGAQYIVNVPGRGYRFVAPVMRGQIEGDGSAYTSTISRPTNLPTRLVPAIGRSKAEGEIAARLRRSNVVTVTGPAGVGKTTIALQVAMAEVPSYPDGVWMVDLAPLQEAEHILSAVATAMRVEIGSADPANALLLALTRKKALLLLDNCEHLIDAVANLAVMILHRCPDIVLLATSREPLRIRGEAVYALPPLDMPPTTTETRVKEALGYPAIQLLVERVEAATNEFVLSDQNVASAISICRQLDGLPLAIEFASALVGTVGLAGLAAGLHSRFRLMQVGVRGENDRHSTLTTALDWSHDLLEATQQVALRRLAVFAGGFTLDASIAILGMSDSSEAGDVLAKLHAKSLVVSDTSPDEPRFRLLETTRVYAQEKLERAGEVNEIRLRHAAYYTELLRRHRRDLGEWDVKQAVVELDNIRTALRFAMGPNGDINFALHLTSAAVPLWLGLSLTSECLARLRETAAFLTPELALSPEGWDLEVTRRMTEMATIGIPPEAYATWEEPARPPSGGSARLISDAAIRFVWNCRRGDASEMKRFANKHTRLFHKDETLRNRTAIDWVDGLCAFYVGEFRQAKISLRRFLEAQTPKRQRVFNGRTGLDRNSHVRGMLGATLCALGEVDEGLREARLGDQMQSASGRAWSAMEGKLWAFVTYEIAGTEPADLPAELDAFLEMARAQGFEGNVGLGLGLLGVLAMRRQRHAEAEELLHQSVDYLRRNGFEWCAPWFQAQLGQAVARQGRVAEGLKIVTSWMQRDQNPTGWYAAELGRTVGSLHALAGNQDEAARRLAEALAIANTQGAEAWAKRIRHDMKDLTGHQPAHQGV